MLFGQRNLALDRHHDVAQICRIPAIRRDTRQDPRTPFLIHEPARAIDWIHDDDKRRRRGISPFGQHHAAARETFGDEHHRRSRRNLALEELDQRVFAHAVDRIDRVALIVCRDAGEIVECGLFGRSDHRVPDLVVQSAQWRQQIGGCHVVAFL